MARMPAQETLIYSTASSRMDSGVLSSIRTALADTIPTILIMADTSVRRYIPLAKLLPTISDLSAPKYCDSTTPTPADTPKLMEKNRKFREPVAPTAASAFAPTKRPTTIESTIL